MRDVLRHHTVGLTGFEPAASSSRTKRATKLRHSPIGNQRMLAEAGPHAEIGLVNVSSVASGRQQNRTGA